MNQFNDIRSENLYPKYVFSNQINEFNMVYFTESLD